MKLKVFLFFFAIFFTFSGCDVAKQLGSAYNFTQCKFNYNSLTNLTLSGTNLSKGLSAANILQLTSLLTGNASSIPLNFTLNLDVTNPNQSAAALSGLQYILNIDDVEFTTGTINQSFNVAANSTQVMPLTIGFDLATLLTGSSKNAVLNIAKNFLGLGNEKSNITFQVKPSFNIGGYPLTSPVYIPVSFSFGGK
ncbi:LEA14-like dessication related protein [Parabacteroides sp. PF5-5]|uniref:LEA type 2 family protein n=1 Tax=unclassified Parabacteroides TaxID=2649774 RepID=UPI002475B6A1|nr:MULTISPECIES: LEA type 2 family protein [unclassified Parabacteroides]MDH6306235.1 LEA14-like dessication related protein [Parabacteroides sp. PH5-39]MDH6316973.1 LEA14-like dessication related protein [Parabacteroides sp. PF5-13]MDH6321043.1 LEA14-like dessication related protein [Parabacteroides sp. PH5-13]MDH6324775.1 LEA14-like dessication related protein [Parabacteroides sp. PH5-8]MDH6328158.1 LEA14-like dessication related protein [Parabacteroides sp. PH5-41]